MKSPGAFLPLTMSAIAFLGVLGYVAVFGTTSQSPDGDEGWPARLFQLLLAGQLPIMAYFAMRWLPQKPRAAIAVLVIQALGMAAAFGLVYLIER